MEQDTTKQYTNMKLHAIYTEASLTISPASLRHKEACQYLQQQA